MFTTPYAKSAENSSSPTSVAESTTSHGYILSQEGQEYLTSGKVSDEDPSLLIVWDQDALQNALLAVHAGHVQLLQPHPVWWDASSPG